MLAVERRSGLPSRARYIDVSTDQNPQCRQPAGPPAPGAGVAFLTATLFYKFGNFALECVGFLATWFVLDAIVQGVTRVFAPAAAQTSD